MADQEPNSGGNGADNAQPQVSILAQYVKDLSVENPSAPQVYPGKSSRTSTSSSTSTSRAPARKSTKLR